MPERDARGRFAKGNTISCQGGYASQARRSPEEKRALGKQGFAALAAKWGWSRRKLAAWLFDPLNYRGG